MQREMKFRLAFLVAGAAIPLYAFGLQTMTLHGVEESRDRCRAAQAGEAREARIAKDRELCVKLAREDPTILRLDDLTMFHVLTQRCMEERSKEWPLP